MNKNIVALAFLVFFQIAPAAISENNGEILWTVSFSLYSGRQDPHIRLDQDEIDKVRNMIVVQMRDAVNVASDDSSRHQGITLYYSDLGGKSSYYGINITAISGSDKRVLKLYPIAGRYLRINSDNGDSSKLYKMKNAEIEKYLVDLAIQKGAFSLGEQNEILKSVNQRKK